MPSRAGKRGGELRTTPTARERRRYERRELKKSKGGPKPNAGDRRITLHPYARFFFALGAGYLYNHPWGCNGNCSTERWTPLTVVMALAITSVMTTSILILGDHRFGARVFDGAVRWLVFLLLGGAALAVVYGVYSAYMHMGMGLVLAMVLPLMIALTRLR